MECRARLKPPPTPRLTCVKLIDQNDFSYEIMTYTISSSGRLSQMRRSAKKVGQRGSGIAESKGGMEAVALDSELDCTASRTVRVPHFSSRTWATAPRSEARLILSQFAGSSRRCHLGRSRLRSLHSRSTNRSSGKTIDDLTTV